MEQKGGKKGNGRFWITGGMEDCVNGALLGMGKGGGWMDQGRLFDGYCCVGRMVGSWMVGGWVVGWMDDGWMMDGWLWGREEDGWMMDG